mgnify:CR=1 FL=1
MSLCVLTPGLVPSDGYEVQENDDHELLAATLQNLLPLAANRDRIFKLMKDSFHGRRNWIKDTNPTVNEILQKYPRFVDTPGLVGCYFWYCFTVTVCFLQ